VHTPIFQLSLFSDKFWLDLYRELWTEYFPFDCSKQDFSVCSFAPVTTGPNAGAYYSELWSEVSVHPYSRVYKHTAQMLACDLLSQFREHGNVTNSASAQMTKLYETVLSRGAVSMKGAFREFR
jgi:Zn-dependent oligopeptidase